jgi:hypothetical protein
MALSSPAPKHIFTAYRERRCASWLWIRALPRQILGTSDGEVPNVAMSEGQKRLYLWIAAAAAAALLLGAGGAWLVRGREVGTLEDRLAKLEAEAKGDAEESTETVETTEPVPVEQPAEEQPVTEPSAEGPREEVTGPSEKQPGYVQSVSNLSGAWSLKIDYVQFLTGGEAADAAAARGDESPPPNDYYIVNDNPKIREFPIKPGISVKVVTNPDGGSDPEGHSVTLGEWAAFMNGTEAEIFRSNLYWVTVTNGTVIAIEAQYVP